MRSIILFLLGFSLNAYSQNLFRCRTDSVIDSSNKIEYKAINDSSYAIEVTLNNIKAQKKYLHINDDEMCKFVPKFVLKFKDSFVFVTGTHQHYRLLTVFQWINNGIVVNEFENELMLNAAEEGFEKMLFFYSDQPAVLLLSDNKVNVKTSRRRFVNNAQNIDAITVLNQSFIVNCKNGRKYKLRMNMFK